MIDVFVVSCSPRLGSTRQLWTQNWFTTVERFVTQSCFANLYSSSSIMYESVIRKTASMTHRSLAELMSSRRGVQPGVRHPSYVVVVVFLPASDPPRRRSLGGCTSRPTAAACFEGIACPVPENQTRSRQNELTIGAETNSSVSDRACSIQASHCSV